MGGKTTRLILVAAAVAGLGVACEAPVATFAVTSTADLGDVDPGDGTCLASNGECTLRAAIDEANAVDEGLVSVQVPAGTYVLGLPGVDDDNAGGDLDIWGRVSLSPQGGAVTVDGGAIDRVFEVHGGELQLLSTTVQDGTTEFDGGGIKVNSGALSLTLSTVRDNVAGESGGGIAADSGTVTVSLSTIEGNTAGASGGGLFTGGGATASVTRSTVSGNTADPTSPLLPSPGRAGGAGTALVAPGAPAADGADHVTFADGRQPYLVQLDVAGALPRTRAGLQARALQIRAASDTFAAAATTLPQTDVDVTRTYDYLPYVAVTARPGDVTRLAAQPGVVAVQPDLLSAPALASSLPVIGGDDVHALGATGLGTSVAIIDTGVDGDEPMTNGKVVAEACFALGSDGVGPVGDCPNGTTSQTGSGAGAPCPWFDNGSSCWHGTHVASTAAGATRTISGVPHTGVAPSAGIVAVNVFSHFVGAGNCSGNPECVKAFTSDQIAGLNWVIGQAGSIDIAAVNMSLGGGGSSTPCDSDSRKASVDQLRALGIPVVISAGNSGSKTTIGAPGCISTALTVGATDDADAVASFSQSASFLDVLAPGVNITAEFPTLPSDPGTDYIITASGTSMAAPHVAGAIAVLHAYNDTLTAAQLEALVTTTGVPVTDSANSITTPRLALDRAFAAESTLGAGGGIASDGTTTVTASTIAGNDAVWAGGIYATGTVNLTGSAVASQAAGGDCGLGGAGGTVASGGWNLDSDGTCTSAGSDLTSASPDLGALAANGGATATHLPGAASPLVDAIPNGTAGLCDSSLTTDQRLSARPNPPGGSCDIGSVER